VHRICVCLISPCTMRLCILASGRARCLRGLARLCRLPAAGPAAQRYAALQLLHVLGTPLNSRVTSYGSWRQSSCIEATTIIALCGNLLHAMHGQKLIQCTDRNCRPIEPMSHQPAGWGKMADSKITDQIQHDILFIDSYCKWKL
jgi:hypothetical protein